MHARSSRLEWYHCDSHPHTHMAWSISSNDDFDIGNIRCVASWLECVFARRIGAFFSGLTRRYTHSHRHTHVFSSLSLHAAMSHSCIGDFWQQSRLTLAPPHMQIVAAITTPHTACNNLFRSWEVQHWPLRSTQLPAKIPSNLLIRLLEPSSYVSRTNQIPNEWMFRFSN